MNGRDLLRYEYLQVTDEMLDVRAPALASLLTRSLFPTSRREALGLLVELERYALRRVVDEGVVDVGQELQAASVFPDESAGAMLELAVGWPAPQAHVLLCALADPSVRAMERKEGAWVVRALVYRYAPYARRKKLSRERTRDNQRAREAGWEFRAKNNIWWHAETRRKHEKLSDVIQELDGGAA